MIATEQPMDDGYGVSIEDWQKRWLPAFDVGLCPLCGAAIEVLEYVEGDKAAKGGCVPCDLRWDVGYTPRVRGQDVFLVGSDDKASDAT
jgi:hypothetical protein